MKVSEWNICIPYNKGEILLNEITNAILYVEDENVEEANRAINGDFQVKNEIINSLIQGGFIIPDDFDETDRLKSRFNAYKFSSKFLRFTIALTLDCNFSCQYCYQSQLVPFARPNTHKRFDEEMLRAVLTATENLIKSERPHVLSITYYGGEPLLELKKLLEFSNAYKKMSKDYDLRYTSFVVTNGYLLTKNVAKKLVQSGVNSALVTLDGTQEFHDKYRPLKDGSGTFETIYRNIKEVTEIMDITLRINISKDSVGSVKKLIRRLAADGVKVDFDFQMIEVVPGLPSNFHDGLLTLEEFAKVEVDLYKEVFKCFPNYEFNPFSEIKPARCDALCKNSFVVEPDGKLYKCWGEVGSSRANVGKINLNGSISLNHRLDTWLAYSPFEDEECKRCKIFPLCMGGCVFNSLLFEKLHVSPIKKPYRCIPLKYNLEAIVKLFTERRRCQNGFHK